MCALSANKPLKHLVGETEGFPVAPTTCIYEGAMLGGNGSGYVRGLTAGDKFKGHSREKRDNTGGASGGELNVSALTGRYRLQVTLTGVAITDAEERRRVYASADDTLTFVANANSYVGRVVRYVTTNTAIVEFDTTGETETADLAYANVADSAAIGASSTDEADFDKTVAIPVEDIKKGDVFNVTAVIQHTGSQTGHTLTGILYLGTEALVNTGALTIGAQNDKVIIQAQIVVRAIGSGGKLECSYLVTSILNTTKAISAIGTGGEVSEAISADMTFKVSGTYGTSNANNTAVLKHLVVEHLHAKAA